MEISSKGVDTRTLLVLLLAWFLGVAASEMVEHVRSKGKASAAASSAEPPTAKADHKLFAQIEESRWNAIELERTYNEVRSGDYSFEIKRAGDAFHVAEWNLKEATKAPAGIEQKEAVRILQKYKEAEELRQDAIRDQLCDEVIAFVGADGRVSKGASVTGAVTRYPKREGVISPLAAEYCDASVDEAAP